MRHANEFEIFLASAPGHEQALWAEARERGWKSAQYVPGGVTMKGGWADVWRANLEVRGANRVLARLGSFKAERFPEFEARAGAFPWHKVLRREVPVRVEATCRQSRIYHSGAAAERIERAIKDRARCKIDPDAGVTIMVRIENDVCTISVDTSGELLHKRGHKDAVNQAPMRETMAALFLRQCGYSGDEPVVDPMCGSGTFVIEAAEIAAGLKAGRSRHFAFEQLATFDAAAWAAMRTAGDGADRQPSSVRCHGSDRDAAAIAMSKTNAELAGVAAWTAFRQCPISEVTPPEGPAGLVIVNPPYGARIGDKGRLQSLYRAFGQVMATRFGGWRVGLVTSESWLAEATGLPFAPPGAPISHGGLRVKLYVAGPMAGPAGTVG